MDMSHFIYLPTERIAIRLGDVCMVRYHDDGSALITLNNDQTFFLDAGATDALKRLLEPITLPLAKAPRRDA